MKKILIIIPCVILLIIIYLLYLFNYIPHKKYSDNDFNISSYISEIDMDNDGIDDQSDILNNAFEYIKKKPKYKSKYYENGYPNDEYGVCTDLVGYALKNAGYDLQELVNNDITLHKDMYDIDNIDKNIDFRRVKNLLIYFKNNSISLTTDTSKIVEWQGGDIVIFNKHIGIVSNNRNKNGIPFLIHHYSPYQKQYEEDILENYGKVIGHYRVS